MYKFVLANYSNLTDGEFKAVATGLNLAASKLGEFEKKSYFKGEKKEVEYGSYKYRVIGTAVDDINDYILFEYDK
jgi:hypothetical protein